MLLQSSSDSSIPEFERFLAELETLSMQALVHKKKFEFSISQVRKFIVEYSNTTSPQNQYLQNHHDTKRQIFDSLYNIRELLIQYDKSQWTVSTVDNPSNTVGTALCGIASKLRELTAPFCKTGSQYFDPDSPYWLQYHILDLKYIASSFKNYLNAGNPADETYNRVLKRMTSIDNFLNLYEKEVPSTGIRVFSPIPMNYQSWRISHDDLEIVKEVGSGVSSTVYYGFDKRDGNEVAIKKFKYSFLSGVHLQAFQRELTILATTRHPCLLGFIGATENPPYSIVTEWMGGGTLYHELHVAKRLNPTMLSIAVYDIARGMQFLHSRHIVHRDLKSLNVLFDMKGFAHICDFGFSRKEDDGKMSVSIGTPHWMAPEMLSNHGVYNSKVDVYSFAIVMWEVLTGNYPYAGLDQQQIVAQVLVNDARPEIPDGAPQPYVDLMRRCWDRSPDVRPTFDQIIKILQTGTILLPNADKKQFLEYTSQFIGQVSDQVVHIESQLEETSVGEEKFIKFIETLEREGIPIKLVDKCWTKFQSFASARPENKARCAVIFLKTSMKAQASQILRNLPEYSIPYEIITNAVELIPTGSEDIDIDIVIAACKNGCADAASVYANSPNHIKLALEMVAQTGVRVNLKAAVADRCVQCLGSSDPSTVCVALRCLVGIGEIKRITPTAIKTYMNSSDEAIRNCVFVAATALLRDGISTPKLMIGDKNITSIATVINNDTISSKSIPTTKALVDYVNANILKSNIENAIDGTNKVTASNAVTSNDNKVTSNDNNITVTSNVTNQPASALPSCDVSTIEINGLKSLLVDNDSSSFSVKHNGTIVTLKPSVQDGLMINDLYKLSNDSGILCVMNDKSLESLEDPTDIVGRYVEYTGKVIEIDDDMLALEVQIPSGVSSVICGIIGKDLRLQNTFTHGNKIYKLPENDKDSNETKLHFVTLFNSGVHYIKTIPGEYVRGSLLVPSKGGLAKQSDMKITNFCIEYMIPRAKVITKIDDKVVAMLV